MLIGVFAVALPLLGLYFGVAFLFAPMFNPLPSLRRPLAAASDLKRHARLQDA